MTEDQKWQREIDIEETYQLRVACSRMRAGETPPSGPVTYLCWWYFEAQQAINLKRQMT